jgi:hypothetical protein
MEVEKLVEFYFIFNTSSARVGMSLIEILSHNINWSSVTFAILIISLVLVEHYFLLPPGILLYILYAMAT